ncbi:hypothetical protein [Amycolatopsis thermoflava]|uniref:hypothetical protein n=1 Tax=Amycolatopsis thermoflava TaxID=84480 RepID=UPI0037F44309
MTAASRLFAEGALTKQMSYWFSEPDRADDPYTFSRDEEWLEPTPLYHAVVEAVTSQEMAEEAVDHPVVGPMRPQFPDTGAVECRICRRLGPVETATAHGDGWVGPCCWTEHLPGHPPPDERSPL